MPEYLVDCHTHLNNYHEGHDHPTEGQCARLFAKLDEYGVDHAVVLTSYKENVDRPGVDRVLEVLAGDPRSTVVEGLRWSGERTDLFAMEERIRAGKVKGIKLYPGYDGYAIDERSLVPVFDIAARNEVPVLIHTGDTYAKGAKVRKAHPLLVDDVAVDHPDVRFVLCHLGSPWYQDAAEVLYKNDNVYADISGLTLGEMTHEFERYMRDKLDDMIAYMGDPGRQLMYGSDWPLVEMGPYVRFLTDLSVDDETRECIAWRTAAWLFDIDLEVSAEAAAASRAAREAESASDGTPSP